VPAQYTRGAGSRLVPAVNLVSQGRGVVADPDVAGGNREQTGHEGKNLDGRQVDRIQRPDGLHGVRSSDPARDFVRHGDNGAPAFKRVGQTVRSMPEKMTATCSAASLVSIPMAFITPARPADPE
jgi:hypothetical protein